MTQDGFCVAVAALDDGGWGAGYQGQERREDGEDVNVGRHCGRAVPSRLNCLHAGTTQEHWLARLPLHAVNVMFTHFGEFEEYLGCSMRDI